MSSQREKWLEALSNVKIADIDDYLHRYNESVRWLIARRIQNVTKITFCGMDAAISQICSKSFTGARVLENLKSITLKNCSKSILNSLKVNCPYLEEVSIEFKSVRFSSSYDAAASMVQNMPRLRCFTFTTTAEQNASSPLLLALAQYCPLLESLHLDKYNDEGLSELVAGCPKLHTLTIDANAYEVTLAGFRALGRSRSITTLNLNTSIFDDAKAALGAMADEGMLLKNLHLSTLIERPDETFNEGVSSIARFAPTLEHLSLVGFEAVNDERLEALGRCHKLRSINVDNHVCSPGHVSGSFLIPMSVGCPLLEKVTISSDFSMFVPEEFTVSIDFTQFFERCPKLKHFDVDIHTNEEVKALTQHCPLVEFIKLGSSDHTIPQEHSEITDVSLVAIAQGLHCLTNLTLNHTQCTDAGLRALAKGKFRCLKKFNIRNGSWEKGYSRLITEKGIEAFGDATSRCEKLSKGALLFLE